MKKVLLAVVIFAAALAFAADTADTLKQADIQFCNDTRAEKLEGWLKWFAPEGYLGTDPTVRGQAKLREFYKPLFERKNLDFRWSPDDAELFRSGDMGYTSGRWTMTYIDDKGQKVARAGNYLTVWQKQKDGSWKILADMGTQDPQPAKNPESAKK